MYMSFSPPVKIFLLSLVFGAFFGVFWDILKIIKKNIKCKNNKITFVIDIIFSTIIAIFTLVFFFMFTYSGFRFFVIIGESLGLLLYFNSISNFVLKLIKPLIQCVIKIIIFIIKVMHNITNVIIKIINTIINIIIKIITPIFIKISKIFKKITCFYSQDKCIMKKLFKFIKKQILPNKFKEDLR